MAQPLKSASGTVARTRQPDGHAAADIQGDEGRGAIGGGKPAACCFQATSTAVQERSPAWTNVVSGPPKGWSRERAPNSSIPNSILQGVPSSRRRRVVDHHHLLLLYSITGHAGLGMAWSDYPGKQSLYRDCFPTRGVTGHAPSRVSPAIPRGSVRAPARADRREAHTAGARRRSAAARAPESTTADRPATARLVLASTWAGALRVDGRVPDVRACGAGEVREDGGGGCARGCVFLWSGAV